MANVLLAASSLGSAVGNTTAALQAAGHTVTPILDTALTSTDVSGYDVIVGVLSTNTQAIANALRATGKPLVLTLVCTDQFGNAGGIVNDTVPYFMGLCGRVRAFDASAGGRSIFTQFPAHPILAGLPAEVTVNEQNNFFCVVEDGRYVGTLLALGPQNVVNARSRIAAFAVEAGTLDLNGVPVNQRIVVLGFLYGGQSAYTSDGITLLDRAIQWAIGEPEEAPDPHLTTSFAEYPVGPAPETELAQFFLTTPTATIERDTESIGGKRLVVPPGTGFRHVLFLDPATALPHDTQEALMKGRFRNPSNGFYGIVLRFHGGPDSASWVALMLRAQTVEINRQQNGSFQIVTSVAFSFEADVDYWFRFRVVGDQYYGKVWRAGDPEPAGWMVTATVAHPPFGWPGVYAAWPALEHRFDYFAWSADGSTVPVPPQLDVGTTGRTTAPLSVPDHGQVEARWLVWPRSGTSDAPAFDSGWSTASLVGVVATGLVENTEYVANAVLRFPSGAEVWTEVFVFTTATQWYSTFGEYEEGYQFEAGDWAEILVDPYYSTWVVRRVEGASDNSVLERNGVVTGPGARDPLFRTDVSQFARDQEVRTAIRYPATNRGSDRDASIGGIALRIEGTPGSVDGRLYYCTLRAGGMVGIRAVSYEGTNSAFDEDLAVVPFAHQPGVWYEMRAVAHGTTLRCKVWPRGEAEPEEWLIEVTDARIPRGVPGIFAAGEGIVEFDRLALAIEGEDSADIAPPAPVIVDPPHDGATVPSDHVVRWTQSPDVEGSPLTHSGRYRELGTEEWIPWFSGQPDGVNARALPGLTSGVMYELEIWANDGRQDSEPARRIVLIAEPAWRPCGERPETEWGACGSPPETHWEGGPGRSTTSWEQC